MPEQRTIVARLLNRECQNDYIMVDVNEQQIERLKELIRIAKVNGLAKSQEDVANLFGVTMQSLRNAKKGIGTNKYVLILEEKLESAGVHVKNRDTVEQQLRLMDLRLQRIERALKL